MLLLLLFKSRLSCFGRWAECYSSVLLWSCWHICLTPVCLPRVSSSISVNSALHKNYFSSDSVNHHSTIFWGKMLANNIDFTSTVSCQSFWSPDSRLLMMMSTECFWWRCVLTIPCMSISLHILPVHPEEKGRGETPFTKNIGFASAFISGCSFRISCNTSTKMLINFSNILVISMQFSSGPVSNHRPGD